MKAPAIKRLRDSHHALARMIAQGASLAEISVGTGYSPGRVSVLKADPTFSELVEFYRGEIEEFKATLHETHLAKQALIAEMIEEEKIDRLEGSPEKIGDDMLDKWNKTALNAIGLGGERNGTSVNVTVGGFDPAQLVQRGREREMKLVETRVLPRVLTSGEPPRLEAAASAPVEGSPSTEVSLRDLRGEPHVD